MCFFLTSPLIELSRTWLCVSGTVVPDSCVEMAKQVTPVMRSSLDRVRDYYNQNAESELKRLSVRSLEYEVTRRFLDKFLPTQATVLDVGSGPGRYAIPLAKQGHSVTLVDISGECLRLAAEEAHRSGIRFERTIVTDGRDLSGISDAAFDGVLCLGPLYHLHQEEDRKKVISQCLRVLKTGGVVFLGFISKYAPISDLVKTNPAKILERKNILHQFIKTGRQDYKQSHAGWTDAYFIDPLELRGIMATFPLTEVALAGVEGMIAQSEGKVCEQSGPVFEAWVEFTYDTAQEKSMIACSEHILYVGRKQ